MTRYLAVFRKALVEQLRSPWELGLVVVVAPLFIFIYWLFLGGGSTSYTLLVLNQDAANTPLLIEALEEMRYGAGEPVLKLRMVGDRAEGDRLLRNHDGAALLVIPPQFGARLNAYQAGKPAAEGEPVVLAGDLTNPTYAVAAVLTSSVVDAYMRAETGQELPVAVEEQPLGGSAARTEFEIYVPGLLVVAMVMMVFTAALRVTREVESGGLKRLALARVTPFEYLAGVSTVQLMVGLAAVLAAFGTAVALGFRSQGPLWLAILTGGLTAFSIIGTGLIVAAFSRNATEAVIIANIPMIFMMFFSGGAIPMPRVVLFTLLGRSIALFDILPQTHAVAALNKILTLGAGLGEVWFELVMVLLLSLLYFAVGVWVFSVRVMRRL